MVLPSRRERHTGDGNRKTRMREANGYGGGDDRKRKGT